MSEKVLEKMFGREFVEKYRQARAKAEQIPKQKLEEIKRFALQNMRFSDNFAVKYDNLDVLLVFAPMREDLCEIRKTNAGNYRAVAVWYGSESLRGPFISIFCSLEEQAKQIVRETGAPTLVVGKLRADTYEGDQSYNLRCLGVIPLKEDSDIIDADENRSYQDIVAPEEEWDLSDLVNNDE